MNRFIRYLTILAATPLLMVAMAGAPALGQGMADDMECVMAELLGEEFGLCNAYCEAMNCDDEVNRQASAKACDKVKAKFEAIALDPLPCLDDPPLNDPPTLDLDIGTSGTGSTATFVSFGDAVPIAVDVEITDSDGDDIVSATVTLRDPIDGANETLSLSPTGDSLVFEDLGGTWSFDSTNFELTITGMGTPALYAEILQQVVYDNALGDPKTTARTVDVLVSDGMDDVTAISVLAVEVGCPCPSFSSDIAVDTALQSMYAPMFRRHRDCNDPLDFSPCYQDPSPTFTQCTALDSKGDLGFIYTVLSAGTRRASVGDRAFDQSIWERRLFELDVSAGCFSRFTATFKSEILYDDGEAKVIDISVEPYVDRRATAGALPWQIIPSFTDAMFNACVALHPRVLASLRAFWETKAGFTLSPTLSCP